MVRRSLPLLFALLLSAPGATAQSRRPALEDMFPASTWLHVRCAGAGGAREAFEKSWAGELAHRKGTSDAIEKHLREHEAQVDHVIRRVRQALDAVGVRPATARALLKGPFAIGLGRPTLVGPAPVPSVLVVVDVSGREAEAREALQVLEGLARRYAPETPAGTFDVGGVRVTKLGLPVPGGPSVCHATIDGYLLVGLNEPFLREALTSRAQGKTLAANPSLARVRSKSSTDPILSMHVDLDYLLGWSERFLPYEAPEIGKAIGIEDLNGIYLALGVEGHSSSEVVYLDAPGSPKGLFKAFAGRPASFKAASRCPADSLFFATASFDAAAFRDACLAILEQLPAQARRELEREFRREVGRELRQAGFVSEQLEQAFSLLGSEASVCALPPRGGLVPELLAFVEVKDIAKAEAWSKGLLDKLGAGGLQTVRFKDRDLHYLKVDKEGVAVLTPCFAFVDGMMIASSNLQTLKNTISGVAVSKGSLAEDERFRKAIGAGAPHTFFAELRLPLMATSLYEVAMPYLESFLRQNPRFGVSPDAVPEPEELAKILDDVTLSVSVDKDGFAFRQRTLVGPGLALAAMGAAADWLLERAGKGGADERPKAPAKGKIY